METTVLKAKNSLSLLLRKVEQGEEVLPPHHEDVFDRMLIAVAFHAQCPVFTIDKRFCDYPVRVIAQH